MEHTSGRSTSRSAAPVFTEILARSEGQIERLYSGTDRLAAPWILTESTSLIDDLVRSGERLDRSRTAQVARVKLEIAFWTAVRRIITGRDEPTPELLPYGDDIQRLAASEFRSRAQGDDGVLGYEARDLAITGARVCRFLARNCRLVGGGLRSSQIQSVQLPQSSLIRFDLKDVHSERLDLSHAAVCGTPAHPVAVHLEVSASIAFGSAVIRYAIVKIIAASGCSVDFEAADFASEHYKPQPDLLSLARVETGHLSASSPAVVFKSCTLPGARFVDSALQGARFEDCSLRGAVFERAGLEGAEFVRCDLVGADFGGAKDIAKARFDSESLRGARGLNG